MSVFCLGSDEIDEHWHQLLPHLCRLALLGHIDVDEVRDDLRTERKQLWGYQDGPRVLGVCVTRVTKDGVCEIYGAAGTAGAERIREVHAQIEQWAHSINCKKLRLQGRKGWARLLKGYAETGVILEKELDDGR